ncbi:response regulator [Motiliproteus sediminis]|uniref:response regulator n=1 Tax=Motiliproteus sediminis TaxID=1468178 RepID=UPI001AF00E5E|nr:response regulator [Motiliproteus sediminis]
MSEVLTTGEVAKHCGVNFRTVIRWIERGYLKSFKLPGRGDNRIRAEDFVAFLQNNDMPVPPEYQALLRQALVVDDDRNMSNSIRRVLVRAGYEVEVANDGFQAGAVLASKVPSVVLLDLMMPGVDGFEVLAYIRSESRLAATKVLVISGLGEVELQRARDAGADAVLAKPFKNEELEQQVNALLGLSASK